MKLIHLEILKDSQRKEHKNAVFYTWAVPQT